MKKHDECSQRAQHIPRMSWCLQRVATRWIDCIKSESFKFICWHYPLQNTTMNIILKISQGNLFEWNSSRDWTFWPHHTFIEVRIVAIHGVFWSHCVTSKFLCGKIVLTAGGKFLAEKDVKNKKLLEFVASQVCRRCVARGFGLRKRGID